ncbi:receptor-type tyrosine-protein kinase FLT3 isoform X2 [Lucilia sericata]|uniref:receptor-type tyrosine-protein kinase FLT3 isoform X2 n=1 Tax=Lucilia sericata TaxID=13632 RepID=UPI0018A836CC|nr:receptor-type tyrosine-protein kinase FLT3 isoform X2 [Lucilia sericata]
MPEKRSVYIILSNLLLHTLNVMAITNSLLHGEITDIETDIGLNENKDELQLKLSWKDNLPNDTSYNVIVTAVNSTECYEMPCSLYGIPKPKDFILIPENPISYLDIVECRYMFGCNYTLVVENSNAVVSKRQLLTIPYCVSGVCSCQHQSTLPKVNTVGLIFNNHTIHLKWSLASDEEIFKNIQLKKISIIINEQTNPSLSWGGKNLPILEKIYPLTNYMSNASSSLSNRIQQGMFKIEINRDLTPGTVLNIHSNVIDELECLGPSNVIKLKVPSSALNSLANDDHDVDNKNSIDDNVRLALILVSASFITAIIAVFSYYVWIKHKSKQTNEVEVNGEFLPTAIPMENNINYVPYIEMVQRNSQFEIAPGDIHIEAEIGEGAFGRVFRATAVNLSQVQRGELVAVKQLKKMSTQEEESEFLKEIEMLQNVGMHSNIVRFLGCCTLERPYFMVMEYVGRGDLLSYLRKVREESTKLIKQNANYKNLGSSVRTSGQNDVKLKYLELKMTSTQSVDSENESMARVPIPSFAETTYTVINDEDDADTKIFEYRLDNKELYDFALQIANGMRFLEEQKITHRDLAARNVLIDDRKTLKISDFGLSRHDVYVNTKVRKLPLRWLSIEAILDNIYTNKSDVWAYGVVLWEIGTLGASPYPTLSNHELVKFLKMGGRLEKPDICTEQIYELMLKCWSEFCDERPSFEEIYTILSASSAYIDISTLSDDYVFPPIKDND